MHNNLPKTFLISKVSEAIKFSEELSKENPEKRVLLDVYDLEREFMKSLVVAFAKEQQTNTKSNCLVFVDGECVVGDVTKFRNKCLGYEMRYKERLNTIRAKTIATDMFAEHLKEEEQLRQQIETIVEKLKELARKRQEVRERIEKLNQDEIALIFQLNSFDIN